MRVRIAEMKAVARKRKLEDRAEDRAEWRRVPLEERLQAVWEMALFWAELERARARKEGREVRLGIHRIEPVAVKRPLKR